MENQKTEMKEITLYGNLSQDGKVFTVVKRPILEDKKQDHFSLKRTFLNGKIVMANVVHSLVQKAQMKIINIKEPGNVVLFCDFEGKIYFYTGDTRCFISEDGTMALSEYGEYYELEATPDGGYDMYQIEPLKDVFPYRFLKKEEEKFDFLDDDDDVDLDPLDVDPFRESEQKSNVIDFETAKFMHERKGR